MLTKKLLAAAAMVAFAAGSAGSVGVAQAKHGSDDGPGHARHHHHHHHHHHHGGDDRGRDR